MVQQMKVAVDKNLHNCNELEYILSTHLLLWYNKIASPKLFVGASYKKKNFLSNSPNV